jgi:hypothetical protein
MVAKRHNRWFLSCLLCAGVLIALGIAEASRGSEQLLHWFVVPVALCGVVVLEDVVKWLRGDVDVFDPIGVLGLFGTHFFFVAPLLHVQWDYWMGEVNSPADWRPWLGGMAALNFVGLLAYRAARAHFQPAATDAGRGKSGMETSSAFAPRTEVMLRSESRLFPSRDPGAVRGRSTRGWRLRPRRFVWCLGGALLLAGALQFLVFRSYGGLWSYVSAVEEEGHAFLGSSRIAMISESFPILAMIGYAVYVGWRRKTPSWPALMFVLTVFCVVKILFGGLHGSRSNIIFAVFWAAGIVHFGIRPIPKKLVIAGLAVLVGLAYLYGFYKSGGVEGLQRALHSTQSRSDAEAETGRTVETILLGDLGRSDVQAFVLNRTTDEDSDYQFAFGRTYVGGVLAILPGPLWRNRPPTKVKEGTDALYGRGSYRERALSSVQEKDKYVGKTSRVFGLAGEALLNFGPLGIPVAFAMLGVVVGLTRRVMASWSRRDPRRFMLPLLVNLCLVMLIGDSDNIVALLEGVALFPLIVLAAGSRRIARNVRPAAWGGGAAGSGTTFNGMPLEGC